MEIQDQLQRVILNLILNAIEAMGGSEPRDPAYIEALENDGRNILVSVSNPGPGLDRGGGDEPRF